MPPHPGLCRDVRECSRDADCHTSLLLPPATGTYCHSSCYAPPFGDEVIVAERSSSASYEGGEEETACMGRGEGCCMDFLTARVCSPPGERSKELDLWTPAHQVVRPLWQCEDCGRPCASECTSFKRGRREQNCWGCGANALLSYFVFFSFFFFFFQRFSSDFQ